MSIFGQIQSSVNSILPSLFTDMELTTNVTWKVFQNSEFDENLGYNVDTYKEYKNIRGIRIEKEQRGSSNYLVNAATSQLGVALGESVYLFQYPDIPVGASLRDILYEVDTSMQYRVSKIFPVFGLITKVEILGYG